MAPWRKPGQAQGTLSHVFAEFIEDTMKAFGYLVRDFGFEHSETTIEVREAVKADYSRRLAEDWREERQAKAAFMKKQKARKK